MKPTKTKIERLPSQLGDVILQRDKVDADGNVVQRDVVMYVPTLKLVEGDKT